MSGSVKPIAALCVSVILGEGEFSLYYRVRHCLFHHDAPKLIKKGHVIPSVRGLYSRHKYIEEILIALESSQTHPCLKPMSAPV
jgi:hypothetical protein